MSIDSASVSFDDGGSGAEAATPIPLRVLIVADLSRAEREVGSEAEARPLRVDKDSFDELFGKLNPAALFEVPNTVTGQGEVLCDLKFASMNDFLGQALAGQTSVTKALLDLKASIAEGSGPETTPDALAEKIQSLAQGAPFTADLVRAVRQSGGGQPTQTSAPPPAASESSQANTTGEQPEGSVDSILSMVEEDDSAQAAAKQDNAEGAMGRAISSIAGAKTSSSKTARNALDAANNWIDEKIGGQLDAVLHHPEFQSIEAAWRGLRFLVSRTDFRKDIVIDVVHARKQDLRKFLVGQVLQSEYDIPCDPPLALVICDAEFDNSPADMDLLHEIGLKCQDVQAPFIAAAGAGFFGRESLQGLGAKGSLAEQLQGPAFAKWKGLRDKDELRWVGLTVNRMLLRRPHEAGAKGNGYPESCDEGSGAGLLWGSGAWALGACATASFAREGWAHSISGARGGGNVEELPLRACAGAAGRTRQIPLETMLSETHVRDLATAGLIPLQCKDRSAGAFFSYAPSVCAPKRFSDPKATQEAGMHSIIAYQLFAARMGAYIQRFLGEVAGAGSGEEIEAILTKKLEGVLGVPAPSADSPMVRVEVSDHDDNPEFHQVCIELRPKFKFFGLTPRLLLAIPLRK